MKVIRLIFKLLIGAGIIYVISVMVLALKPGINDFFNRTEFVSREWINWEDTESSFGVRWNMTHDLIQNYDLIGKTRKEIEQLLGKPTRETKYEMRYYLGLTGHGINTGALTFEFKNDRVTKFEIWQG
ncbi:hypothetical protein SAMN04487906_2056 [Zhouia amylolytica]|uniref:Uncharacterized protein n=1 Tax=Zhouia amylolytica TaxID=376730 RepID=A0A1I6TQ29_9FLAO|nr:hypothetical protein [Zhouia amylolytica]SFS91306.1 hypothetical protein SAMN04487906_2056 [Zhouia amylolytica]